MSDPTMAIVPRQPTEAMLDIGAEIICNGRDDKLDWAWRAMIAAYEADTTPALRMAGRSRVEAQRDLALQAVEALIRALEGGYHKPGGFLYCEQCAALKYAEETIANIAEIEKTAPQTEARREAYDGDGSQRLVLRSPASAVHSLMINGLAIPDRISGANSAPGYLFTPPNQILLAGYVFTRGLGSVVVVYEPEP